MRNRDAQAADAELRGIVDESRKILARHAEGNIHLVHPEMLKRRVVDQRAEAVADRIGHHAVDLGVGVDLVVVVDFGHLLEGELAGGHRPLVMKRGKGERSAELARQDSRRYADVAHAEADRRHFALPDQPEHPQIVVRMVGHDGDFDDVRIKPAQAAMDVLEVVRRFAEVVQADDPLGAAETRDHAGNVFFQIDIFHALGDGRAQQQQALLFGTGELAAVGGAAAGDHHRTRPIGHQPFNVHFAVDVIQTQLDQSSALFDQVSVFCNHVAMTAAANADADHCLRARQ